MKESFYQWVKTLAVFYILFSAVLHLIPDPKYERYIRSFMGLLLIYILCTPVFAAFGRESELAGIFSGRYTQEMQTLETEEAENLQEFYLREGYCREIETEIAALCKKKRNKTDRCSRTYRRRDGIGCALYRRKNDRGAGKGAERCARQKLRHRRKKLSDHGFRE